MRSLSVLLVCLAASALADDVADQIRKQEKAFSKSMVWLKVTVTDDQGNENTDMCSGPVLRREGGVLIVAPDVPVTIKALKIIQPDGKEVEAEVVAHDADIGFMFVRPKDKEAAAALAPLETRKSKAPAVGDPLLLIDRRSHTAPDETTCRMVRVNCLFTSPEPLTFYTGLNPQQQGGLVVTPEGELVGMVGLYKDRDEEGQEQRGIAVLPMEKVLASLESVKSEEKKP